MTFDPLAVGAVLAAGASLIAAAAKALSPKPAEKNRSEKELLTPEGLRNHVEQLGNDIKRVEARNYYAMALQFVTDRKYEDAEDLLNRVPKTDVLYLTARAALAEVYARQGLTTSDPATKAAKFEAAFSTIDTVLTQTDEIGYRLQRAAIRCLTGSSDASVEADLEFVVAKDGRYAKYIKDRAHDEFAPVSDTAWFRNLIVDRTERTRKVESGNNA